MQARHAFLQAGAKDSRYFECPNDSPEWLAALADFNLETAVGCARVCRERRAWQGETKQRTLVRNEEQRRQVRRARCNRVHSAVT